MRRRLRLRAGMTALLCAALLCAALPVHAAPGDTSLFAQDSSGEIDVPYVRSVAVVGDAVYLLADGLYSYRVGEEKPMLLDDLGRGSASEKPEQVEEAAPQAPAFSYDLLIGGDKLGVLDVTTGKYRLWDGKAFAAEDTQLDWSGMTQPREEYTQNLEIATALISGDAMYLLAAKDFDSWGEYNVRRFELASGALGEVPADSVQQIAPYKPGKFVALRMDVEKWVPSIVVVDMATGAVEQTLYTWDQARGMSQVMGVTYDAAADKVYCITNGEIVPVEQDKLGEAVAYLAVNGFMGSSFSAILPSGHLVFNANVGVFVRNLDPQYKPSSVLRIAGSYMDEATLAFARENPDVAVVMSDAETWQSKSVIDTMISQDASVDLLQVPGRGTLRALRAKGYLTDLSGSQKLMDSVKAMYPQVQEAVLQDGKLDAFPADLYASFWRLDTAALEELGLDVPTTIGELLELTRRWYEEDMAEEHPQYMLFDQYIGKQQLMFQIVQQYAILYERPGEPLRFNAPELRAALEQWEALPAFGPDMESPGGGVTIVRDDSEETKVLIELNANAFFGGRYDSGEGEAARPLLTVPAGFAAGDEPAADGTLMTYVVNPNSANAEVAVRYLEYLADHAAARERYALRPDLNEPVMHPFMAKFIAEQEAELEARKKELETAEEADRQSLQESIDTQTRNLERNRRNGWMIDPESLAEYRALAPRIRLNSESLFFGYDDAAMEETWKVLQRYAEGQVKLDEMLREMDKKLQMIFLEGQ